MLSVKKIIFSLLIVFILFPLSSQAVGLEINPAELNINVPQTANSKINIKNISPEAIAIKVSADNFADKIILIPQELTLLPQESAVVEVRVNFLPTSKKLLATNISVVGQSLDKKSFNAASGLKIPLAITILPPWWAQLGILSLGAAVLLLILSILIYMRLRKKAQ